MAKAPKEPKRAPPCIFCDNPRDSEEHFWPTWMHSLLPTPPDPRYDRTTTDFHPATGTRTIGRKASQGNVTTIRLGVVCSHCNNGWMNRLEEAVRPLISPLIRGEPVTLDAEQTSVISRWIAMKCIVAEHSAPDRALTPRADREALRTDETIPPYFRIYLANQSEHGVAYFRNSQLMAVGGPMLQLPEAGMPKNIQTITFLLGRVFVHVVASRVINFELEQYVSIPKLYLTSRIWPPDHREMAWSHKPIFSPKEVGVIARSLGRFFAAQSKKTWLPPSTST